MRHFAPSSKYGKSWQSIAWSGIAFEAPGNWHIGKIGEKYLMLDDGSQPALDVQWGSVSTKFDAHDYLHQLNSRVAAVYTEQQGLFTQRMALPPTWQEALRGFEVHAFMWWETGCGGKGVVVYCPHCHTASMIRFYHAHGARFKQTVALRLLSSFRDHREDDTCIWSLYDVRARLPRHWQIKQFRFQPAKYELVFSSAQKNLTLYRWKAPQTTLAQFAEGQVSFPWHEAYTILNYSADAGEWYYEPDVKTTSSLLDLIKPAYNYYWLRLWRLPRIRRLLGIAAVGNQPLDMTFLKMVCADYEST